MAAPIVFDIETRHTFAEVKNDTRKLGVSVAVAYDYQTSKAYAFEEHELSGLFALFEKASVLVGFNSQHFDLVVLDDYYVGDLFKFPHFDILEDVKEKAGHRYPLDDLIKATLGKGKTGHGLQAVQYFREGKFKELKAYCQDDVMLTKELLDYGIKNGYVYLPTATSKNKLFVNWQGIMKDKEKQTNNTNLTLGF